MPTSFEPPAVKLLEPRNFVDLLLEDDEDAVLDQIHGGIDLNKYCVGVTLFLHLLKFDFPRVTEVITQKIFEGKVYSLSVMKRGKTRPLLSMAHPVHHALLQKMGEDINACKDDGCPPLLDACEQFTDFSPQTALQKIKSLLALGADPGGTNKDGFTALMLLASLSGTVCRTLEYKQAVDALIDAGCDLHRRSLKGFNALIAAVTGNGNLPAVLLLLEHGATFDEKSGQIEAVAKEAIVQNDSNVLANLLVHGLNPIPQSAEFIHHAFLCDSPSALAWLLKEGCDPQAKNAKGQTIFDVEATNESCLVVAPSCLAKKAAHLAADQARESGPVLQASSAKTKLPGVPPC